MKSLIKPVGLVALTCLLVFFVAQLLHPQEAKQIKPSKPARLQDTTIRLGSESPTAQETQEASEQENKSAPVEKSGKTPPLFPGPDAILKAQIHIRTEEDVKTLRDLGLECCADTGVCECQVSMGQLRELVGHGLEMIKASTIDTPKWGEETKPKSDMIIPPKPKPQIEEHYAPHQSQTGTRNRETKPKFDNIVPAKPKPQARKEIFSLIVKIKTGKEMEVIKRIGMQAKFVGDEAFCVATQQQIEELKKEGIEFEVQKEKRKEAK